MNSKIYPKRERIPSHAGRILKSGFIDQYGLRIETVAGLLGITRGHLSRIINGHQPVTPDIALRLEVLTKTPAHQWLTLQSKYDAYVMESKEDFQKYKQALDNWSSNSLPLLPDERRTDKKTLALVKKAASLARQLQKKTQVA